MDIGLALIAGVGVGWWARGYIDQKLVRLLVKVLVSSAGKKRVNVMLMQALAAFEDDKKEQADG